jgi:hypothetical protein
VPADRGERGGLVEESVVIIDQPVEQGDIRQSVTLSDQNLAERGRQRTTICIITRRVEQIGQQSHDGRKRSSVLRRQFVERGLEISGKFSWK